MSTHWRFTKEFSLIKDAKINLSLPITISRKRKIETLDLLKQAVCYTQGRYIEFEFLVSEKHKALKDAVTRVPEQRDLNEIEHRRAVLLGYMERQLQAISKRNFQFLQEYFLIRKRSVFYPRICIKVLKSGGKIADAYRSEKRGYLMLEHSVEENTGFKSVVDDGTFFFENDVPERATRGLYVNPRLDQARVRNYRASRKSGRGKEIDQDWVDCWYRQPSSDPSLKWQISYYKSTIIVPMTLMNNDLDNEFRDCFFGAVPDESRAMWGFLCFDHPIAGYFLDDDVKIGYIFADLLSLYFISAHIHTSRSQTFQKACSLPPSSEKKEISHAELNSELVHSPG